jgi:signal transduction histidine kinase
VTGVLNLGCYRPKAYEKKDIKLMSIVAAQCAVSIERQFYQRQIEEKNRELTVAHRRFREAQAKIIAGEKMQAMIDLATIVNHEINNPLAVIVGNLQCLLVESDIPSQKMLGRLKRIESAALQISDVNRKLLSFNDVPRAVQMVDEPDESELVGV